MNLFTRLTLGVTVSLAFTADALSAERIISADAVFTRTTFFSSAFGSTLESLPVNINIVVEDTDPGIQYLAPGTQIASDGSVTTSGMTLIPTSAIVSLSAQIGDGAWTAQDLTTLNLFDSGLSYNVILDGDFDNSTSVQQTIGLRTVNFDVGEIALVQFACFSANCVVAANGLALDYFFGADGIVSNLTATVTTAELTPEEQISDLKDEMIILGINDALIDSIYAEADATNGDKVSAVNKLNGFINKVEAQRGKKLTDAQTNDLVVRAQAVITSLSQ